MDESLNAVLYSRDFLYGHMGSKHWTCGQVMKKKKSGAQVRRQRQMRVTKREKEMNQIRKIEDAVLRQHKSVVDPQQELSDFWYSAGRWEVFPRWMNARQKKVVRDFLANVR